MGVSFYSDSWHRVASLTPRLRSHVDINRQMLRGDVWYVVQDNQTGRFHRISGSTRQVIHLMDGKRTVEEIWMESANLLGNDQPSQDDLIKLLSLLYSADLLVSGTSPHMEELAHRSSKARRRDILSRVKNPLAVRIRLIDPDRFLEATTPFVGWLFSVWGLILWGALVVAGGVVAVMNADAMAGATLDHVLSAQNLLLLVVTYPVVKALHELGHSYAVKHWGGEVHELGVMMLVLMPVPYVDASASIGFPQARRRAIVAAAGIMVELAIAALAVIFWSVSEPGLLRALALNAALIGGVSSLFFNGNPLLRFDGYYVLCDLLQIPNLGPRANQYVAHLIKRYAFGLADLQSPVTARGEAGWFLFYAIASFFYRTAILIGIAFYIAGYFFFIGIALAMFAVFSSLVLPVLKILKYLFADPKLRGKRPRALAVSSAAFAGALMILFVLPFPYATVVPGIVWIDNDQSIIRAESDGFVAQRLVRDPRSVTQGDELLELSDSILSAEVAVARSELEELKIRQGAAQVQDRVQAGILREQIRSLQGRVDEMERELGALTVVAPDEGTFVPAGIRDTAQRFIRRGDVVGYLVRPGDLVVKVLVPQESVDLVRNKTQAVSVRMTDDPGQQLGAVLARGTPAAVSRLPHPALAAANGGVIAVDPTAPERLTPLEAVFEFDVQAAALGTDTKLGMRSWVRFAHPAEAIGFRLMRMLRQVFLKQFNV